MMHSIETKKMLGELAIELALLAALVALSSPGEGLPWQKLVVLAALAWALAYVGRRAINALQASGSSGCGSCGNAGGCSTANGSENQGVRVKPFVSIDSLHDPSHEAGDGSARSKDA